MTDEKLEQLRQESMEAAGFGPRVMRRLKVCPECGSIASASQRFCRECGKQLPGHTLYQRYKENHCSCPVCDIVVPDEARYCPQCGQLLEHKLTHNIIN